MSLLPEDVDKYISKAFKKGPKGDEETPADAPPDQRTGCVRPARAVRAPTSRATTARTAANMRQLIETKR